MIQQPDAAAIALTGRRANAYRNLCRLNPVMVNGE
jgi:hypothetical protein